MNTGMFGISQDGNTESHSCSFYSSHGEFKGVADVISSTDISGARKFFTRETAQAFINAELPDWAKHTYIPVEIKRYNLLMFAPDDYQKLLEWEANRRVVKITLRINPEDSKGVGIMEFYDRLAGICGLDSAATRYDCTKINVSKNIQSNIFEVLDAQCSDPCYTGMMWVARGPKTYDELPDDTVELLDGFFTAADETFMPFNISAVVTAA